MKPTSKSDLDNLGEWYLKSQLEIDKLVINKRYEEHKQYFVGKSCLELGPAEGVMTRNLVNDFEKITVIEGSKMLLEEIEDAKNLTKIHGLFEEVNIDETFDTIIADHIFEHVDDPDILLKKVKTWMKKESRLIIGVPNANSFHRILGEKLGMLNSRYDLNPRDLEQGHQRVYDFDTLEELVRNNGLKVIEKGGLLFKPLSFAQLEKLFDMKELEALFAVGEDFQENCSEMSLVVTL
jgi:2-polyprenyl-3-methyl-5-hydroxy-6-metoxy-1,4-benzoquinol methylase|tara:strand:- start:281 stop:991 length:711 start_codon:yes stop_codon:yes gene_type:complete